MGNTFEQAAHLTIGGRRADEAAFKMTKLTVVRFCHGIEVSTKERYTMSVTFLLRMSVSCATPTPLTLQRSIRSLWTAVMGPCYFFQ